MLHMRIRYMLGLFGFSRKNTLLTHEFILRFLMEHFHYLDRAATGTRPASLERYTVAFSGCRCFLSILSLSSGLSQLCFMLIWHTCGKGLLCSYIQVYKSFNCSMACTSSWGEVNSTTLLPIARNELRSAWRTCVSASAVSPVGVGCLR